MLTLIISALGGWKGWLIHGFLKASLSLGAFSLFRCFTYRLQGLIYCYQRLLIKIFEIYIPMPNLIAASIQQIVNQRTQFAERISDDIQRLSLMSHSISVLENVKQKVSDHASPHLLEAIRRADLPALLNRIEAEQQYLSQLNQRFSRKGISIGVIGRARQGKSRLLQSLSGLDHTIIPDGNGSHCTGVLSVIANSDQKIRARVEFYSRTDFFQSKILPYFKELPLSPAPANLAEFVSQELPEPPAQASTVTVARYKKLQEIHENFTLYHHLLTGLTLEIPAGQIRQYVAQVNESREPIFYYLAVKQVHIQNSFPLAQAGPITLIDMPGLGDTGLVNEENLIRSLASDIDFILFVRKPDPLGATWEPADLDLYQFCEQAITQTPGVSLPACSFLVLNHTKGSTDNAKNCQDLFMTAERNGLHFSQMVTVDCSSAEEVEEKVFKEVLKDLQDKLKHWDQQYEQNYQRKMNQLDQSINQAIDYFNGIVTPTDDMKDFPIFKGLFNSLWQDLTNACENELKQLEALRDSPNQKIQDKFDSIKEDCLRNLSTLTVANIEISRNALGSYNKTYEEFLNENRTYITKQFLKLGDTLNEVLQQVKHRMYDILKNQGKLQGIIEEGESFEVTLLRETQLLEELHTPVQSFIHFQLSYLGFLHFRIREHLDTLTPDYISVRLSREDTAEDILNYITNSVEASLYKIQNEFNDWAKDLNKMSFALVEELIDQIFRAKNAKDNWEIFYQHHRMRIWVETYQELNFNQNVLKQSSEQVDKLRSFLPGMSN
ncbi:Skp family chaperone for outer membrane proteins [Siphonobacter sp. SORGH_AS 1065]|nr:Skp family chaperone for outer membrane proteins [Siphonobacter sp. SORGH_AS_1065]